ncbi:hypothetical protein [Microbacterium sp.]|uniref:hypothetical protein n=1 Tax=Microbacterium sp. TaxID=51671 RepID=UPI0026279CAD|nr:hypothetical protein [Microbacterium sp.]MCV0333580.1 hypothetical protein [Microbacterium sp.]MCV0374860.1 hypothetical protein [Microbacterium sp.]MCV0388620.1 hypothetical protein [Microbacterium sp.]MCV0417148.1 hypothetical protein [Microbacterium sp.]MCV0420459.1 hypothetical protein [Microbacterium sp.]
MPHHLLLADADTAKDVLTFVGRAARISDEGVRLQATGGVLALTTAALAPHGLFDQTPTILAMRIVHADPELECDVVVDQLTQTDGPDRLALPDTGLSPAWAGIAPPRGPWERSAVLDASTLARRAQWGISAVARGATPGAGEEAVRALRAAIWGEPDEELEGLPRGVAFAADAMGFISGEEQVSVTRSGRWTRLAFRRGHVLSRGPVASGLTSVRQTGVLD